MARNDITRYDLYLCNERCSGIWPHDNLSFFGKGCRQEFRCTCSWTVPTDASVVRVRAIGGGGSGSKTGSPTCCNWGGATGGGGGGYGFGCYDVTPGSTICITVGQGGRHTDCSCIGVDGGTSSFGTCLSVTGGKGGCCCGLAASGGCSAGGQINRCGGRGGCWKYNGQANYSYFACSATGGGAAGYIYGNGGNGGDAINMCPQDCFVSGGGSVYLHAPPGDCSVTQNTFEYKQYNPGGPDAAGRVSFGIFHYCNSCALTCYIVNSRCLAGPGAGGGGFNPGYEQWFTIYINAPLGGGGGGATSAGEPGGNGGFPGGGGGGTVVGGFPPGQGGDGFIIVEW